MGSGGEPTRTFVPPRCTESALAVGSGRQRCGWSRNGAVRPVNGNVVNRRTVPPAGVAVDSADGIG